MRTIYLDFNSKYNQLFRYDEDGMSLVSAMDTNMCLDANKAVVSGKSSMKLDFCQYNNIDQTFLYNATAKTFHNPYKHNLCIDDSTGSSAMASSTAGEFALRSCDSNSVSQQLDVVRRADLMAALPPLPPALQQGRTIMLRVRGKQNLCLDDGGGTDTLQTELWGVALDVKELLAAIPPLPTAMQDNGDFLLRVAGATNSVCVDDGGGVASNQSSVWDWACGYQKYTTHDAKTEA